MPALPNPPPLLVRSALWLHRRLLELAWAVLPPEAYAFDLALGAARTRSLATAVELGLFDLLDPPGRTSAEVADTLGLDPDATHRFLRAVATTHLVRVDRSGRFVNTAAGAACRQGRGVDSFARYFASGSNLAAWGAVEHSLRTGRSAFAAVHGRSVWEHFDDHPEELAAFTDAMAFLTAVGAPAVARAFPFRDYPRLCDVGGGRGTLTAEILVRHPGVHATLVDRPAVLTRARSHLAARGVSDRAELVPGDFFREVPPGRDAYLLKNVLHDWDDPRSTRILEVVRAGCRPGARVLVIEDRLDHLEHGPTAIADLQMLIASDGGRERSEAEFAALFGSAGFEWVRSWPTGSLLWVFEGAAV